MLPAYLSGSGWCHLTRAAGRRVRTEQAAYLGAGLHGRVALADAIPTFPWPPEDEYIDRMIELPITGYADIKRAE
jgi:hypothetical protein